jgi:hypothetical protein
MAIAAVIISILALLFTVFSFWWMYWRKGNLHVSRPRIYAAIGSAGGKMVVEIPLTFFNDGPIPIVIENLQLVFPTIDGKPIGFMATVGKIGSSDNRAFATQFSVPGRDVKELICEFQREQGFAFTSLKYPLILEAQLGDNKEWVKLLDFSLNVNEADATTINRGFLVRDNTD